jgi:CRISPR-associated endonuclease/helicase Cas3
MVDKFIAHVKKNDDETWAEPHLLKDHLIGTANLSGKFSHKFNSRSWGEVIGFLHDLGKGRQEWQNYLCSKSGYDEDASLENIKGKLKHAIFGAKFAEEQYTSNKIGRLLAYCIAGHHTGIPDWSPAEGNSIHSSLQIQLQNLNSSEMKKLDHSILDLLTTISFEQSLPRKFEYNSVDLALWIRMLYSSLVDADFLDTESYMEPNRTKVRGGYKSLMELYPSFVDYIKQLEDKSESTITNQLRKKIRLTCQDKAKNPPGNFSLAVPTGGGKTLSSLAFAMEHAKLYGMDRIIYVIPYTSIIEQNSEVMKEIFGSDQVVEHHSNIDTEDSSLRSRLATENWDAPVIVTTTVQFFESLFAVKPSKCRKLHNIVNSIVILDEAQLLPLRFLKPILNTMNILSKYYHITFIISTATQPAFKDNIIDGKKFKGLENISEIMDDIESLESGFERVEIKFPENFDSISTWKEIAEELIKYKQVLCIVSDRKSCRELYNLMPQGTFHLSALMCGEHRSKTIKEIKNKLKNGSMVRVISTQLVEAGVDIDFPVVYRAMAGLDSIAQASGRCNREGKLKELGKVFIFNQPKKAPIGILRRAEETSKSILMNTQQRSLGPTLFNKYFLELYWKEHNLDSEEVITSLTPDPQDLGINFRTAAKKFRIIDDSNLRTILVRYGKGKKYIDELKVNDIDWQLLRKLQRYTVNIQNSEFYDMLGKGSIEEVKPNIFALSSDIEYSEDVGLLVNETIYDPDKFMV